MTEWQQHEAEANARAEIRAAAYGRLPVFPDALSARVAAQNRANWLAVRFHADLIERYRPFLGQKIIKNGNGWPQLTKKVAAAIGEIADEPGAHVSLVSVQYSLRYEIRVNRDYDAGPRLPGQGSRTTSASAGVYVGQLEGDILNALTEPSQLRDNYSADEIRRLRAEYIELCDKASAAKSALEPFGEYDNR
jgi:hypothetical protein